MTGRQVHAIRINLHTLTDRSIIIWLDNVSPKLCVQLMNPRHTWLTARAGDSVDLMIDGKTSRQYIESVGTLSDGTFFAYNKIFQGDGWYLSPTTPINGSSLGTFEELVISTPKNGRHSEQAPPGGVGGHYAPPFARIRSYQQLTE